MPLLFCIGMQGALEDLATMSFLADSCARFVDFDKYVLCPRERVKPISDALARALFQVAGMKRTREGWNRRAFTRWARTRGGWLTSSEKFVREKFEHRITFSAVHWWRRISLRTSSMSTGPTRSANNLNDSAAARTTFLSSPSLALHRLDAP